MDMTVLKITIDAMTIKIRVTGDADILAPAIEPLSDID